MRKAIGVTMFVVLGLAQATDSSAQSGVGDLRLKQARNVAIGFEYGLDFTTTAPSSDDRDAYLAVRYEIERSRRFWIVSDRKAADVLIVVRVRSYPEGWSGGAAAQRHGMTFRGERATLKADELKVYDTRSRMLGLPLWTGRMIEGLSGDQPLVAELLAHLEKLAKQP